MQNQFDYIFIKFNKYNDINLDFRIRTEKIFSIPDIEEKDIKYIVNHLNERKATGSDGIPAKFVKMFLKVLMPYLLFLINSSIKLNIFPIAWKIGRVSALHKSFS